MEVSISFGMMTCQCNALLRWKDHLQIRSPQERLVGFLVGPVGIAFHETCL